MNKKQETPIKMYCLNLRCGAMADKRDGEENRPCYRMFRIKKQVEQYDPDVIAFQEFTTGWAGMLPEALPQYTIVNKWRNSPLAQRKTYDLESAPVAYKTDKYEELDHGWFWLSETPEISSPPYMEGQERITIWVKLRDKKTGGEFVFASTHFSFYPYSIIKSGRQLEDWMASWPEGTPVFIWGDYNVGYRSKEYNSFAYRGNIKNLWDVALDMKKDGLCQGCEMRKGTHNGFKFPDANCFIDFCFIKKNAHMAVDRYDILYDNQVAYPEMEIEPGYVSDHFASYAEIRLDTDADYSKYMEYGPEAQEEQYPEDLSEIKPAE